MVQHIRKKHPEFAQLASTNIHTPLTTAVISSAPAVIAADGTTAEAVVVRKSCKHAVQVELQRSAQTRDLCTPDIRGVIYFSPQTSDLLTQAMTELSQTLTTDYRTPQGDYQRIQYIPVSQAGGSLSQPQHIQLQVVQVAPVRSRTRKLQMNHFIGLVY